MTLAELIRSRRSISDFTDQPIPEGLIEELLETAVWSPNHHLTEPWRFIYITGDGKRRYAEIRRDMALENSKTSDPEAQRTLSEQTYKRFISVPAYLVVVMQENADPMTREEDYGACCCLVNNLMLLAWERGLASSWRTPKINTRLREYFGLQEREKMVALVQLGYPKSTPTGEKRNPAKDRLAYIKG